MRRLLGAVFLVSAAVLAFEVSLLRLLLVASWHHFAFLVISVALLGFGASGTALFFFRSWAVRHAESVLLALSLGTAAAMPLCAAISQHVPVEARFVPALLWRQAGAWILYWGVLTIPFFLGAAVVGLALMVASGRAGIVYGANLLGSAAGALAAPAAMTMMPPVWLPLGCGCLAMAAAVVLGAAHPAWRPAAVAATVVAVAGGLLIDRPHVRLDPFKDGARMSRLAEQGSVQRVGSAHGPRAVIEAYRGEVLHDLPFLAVGGAPPPVSVLLVDGHLAGSVLEVGDVEAAAVVDQTLMAVPYDLIVDAPRVALLGETGGANVWLAARHRAASIDLVQPDANVIELLRGPLGELGGAVVDRPEVRVHVAEPRHFIEQTEQRFDLIQLSAMEALSAGSSGVGGLAQDHLMTVEGITACLRRLDPDGVLAVSRGMQTPPRDNIKILATMLEGLRRLGVDAPEAHVVVVRDYLAVCTMVRRTPWPEAAAEHVRAVCRSHQLTPVWFEGVRPGELNQPDAMPQPPGGVGDWYHHAMRQLAGPQRRGFVDRWAFDIRPPTDDRPFFGDYGRLTSIAAMRAAFGDLWLTRTELAFLFVVAAAIIVAAVGAAATVLPLPWLPTHGAVTGRGSIVAYFGSLGLAYLLLEMLVLSRMTFLVGDPVRAAAVTIGGFLFFSGLGSLSSQRVGHRRRAVLGVALLLVVLGVACIGLLGALGPAAGGLPVVGRCLVGLLLIAPLAYVMGFPMPLGLARLAGSDGHARIAWAWGTNGFASVLAAPLALVVAMTWGYVVAAAAALGLYLVAGAVFGRLPAGPMEESLPPADSGP